MQTKLVEVRDRATFIACIAIKLGGDTNPDERYLLRRAGYSCEQLDGAEGYEPYVLLTTLDGGRYCYYDPFDWGNRTLQTAHRWLIENWDLFISGSVLDVEFVLGEKPNPKLSERHTVGG